jgi:hypothetical protein
MPQHGEASSDNFRTIGATTRTACAARRETQWVGRRRPSSSRGRRPAASRQRRSPSTAACRVRPLGRSTPVCVSGSSCHFTSLGREPFTPPSADADAPVGRRRRKADRPQAFDQPAHGARVRQAVVPPVRRREPGGTVGSLGLARRHRFKPHITSIGEWSPSCGCRYFGATVTCGPRVSTSSARMGSARRAHHQSGVRSSRPCRVAGTAPARVGHGVR